LGEPTNTQHGLAGGTLQDPAFLSWAKKQGKPINPSTPTRKLIELLAQYSHELREKTRKRAERNRRSLERKNWRGLQNRKAVQLIPGTVVESDDQKLREKIRRGWRKGDRALRTQAEGDLNQGRPVKHWLFGSHGADREIDRWSYLRYYVDALNSGFGSGQQSEEQLLDQVVFFEKNYLKTKQHEKDRREEAARPSQQRKTLRAWAKMQDMNPADNFEPGIACYSLATAESSPDWVDKDIKEISIDGDRTVISYTRGKSIRFSSKALDFKKKYQGSVVELFARRHKSSKRLVPFALYDASVDLYSNVPATDALSSNDRVLMALPIMLTPAVLAYYYQDPYLQAATGLLDVLKLMSLQKGLPIGAPVAASALSGSVRFGTQAVTTGRAAWAEVTFAVSTYGLTPVAANYIGRSAYTYYLTNAVALNTAAVVGTELAFNFAGHEMGFVSPADSMFFATQVDDVLRAGGRGWKVVQVDILDVEKNTGKAIGRVTSVESISDDVAKAEYDLGKVLKGEPAGAANSARGVGQSKTNADLEKSRGIENPVSRSNLEKATDTTSGNSGLAKVRPGAVAKGKGKVKLQKDTRITPEVSELELARKKYVEGLERAAIKKKYKPEALEKVKNISAVEIIDAGIRPSDLAELANRLSRARSPAVRDFVNNFYDVPGFEQVLLSYIKRHYWNTRPKVPVWRGTKAFHTGTLFVMKYATKNLDPKLVHFEWPVSINDTKWGGEVFARYVDIVVRDGTIAQPGRRIQLELKSWTAYTLRSKSRFPTGASTRFPGGIGYQLLRDTAIFRPDNIRWVFDLKKVTKEQVIEAFQKVIAGDAYLLKHWGGKDADPATIRKLLDKVIEVF
jgi:hypothetical protein